MWGPSFVDRHPGWPPEEVLDLGAIGVVIDEEKRVEALHAYSQALHRAREVDAADSREIGLMADIPLDDLEPRKR